MPAEVVINRTTPIYRSPHETGVFVQWTVEGEDVLGVDTFLLERAGAPEGPWEQVVDNVKTYFFFDDLRQTPEVSGFERENLNFLSLHRGIYYRVTGRDSEGNTYASPVKFVGDTLKGRTFFLKRKLVRDMGVSLKLQGVPVSVVKKKHWGSRCSDCYDRTTKKVVKSKCNSCYGTGYEGGYWSPVDIRGRFTVTNTQTQITEQGLSDVNQLRLYLLDYPKLEPDDIVVHTAQNRRFVVNHRAQTELNTVAVHQVLLVTELPRDSIEYRIPIDDAVSPIIY